MSADPGSAVSADPGGAVSAAASPVRSYLAVFAVLCVLTAAELGVVHVPGIGRPLLILALVTMALAKAALVLLFFMHLHHEARGLKLTVLLPFVLPALLAVVLMADAVWRTG